MVLTARFRVPAERGIISSHRRILAMKDWGLEPWSKAQFELEGESGARRLGLGDFRCIGSTTQLRVEGFF